MREWDPDRLADAAASAAAFTAHLFVPHGRLGLRHLALVAVAARSFRRALVLADAAARLPDQVVRNLVPVGKAPTRSLVESVSDQAGEALYALLAATPDRGRVPPPRRPWRSVLAVLEGAELPEDLRRQAVLFASGLDESGAWLLHAFLRLALREERPADRTASDLAHLVLAYRILVAPGRKRWWPWNPQGKGRSVSL